MTSGTLSVADVITRVQRTFGDESSAQVTQADIIRWINDAQREAVMQNEGLLTTTGFVNTVAGTDEYSLPSDCFVLLHVFVKDGASAAYYAVKWLALAEFTQQIDGWDGAGLSSYPVVFTQENRDKLTLFPLPTTSVAQGIKLIYGRYATDVVDTNSTIDLPVYLHNYVVNYCLLQAYEMDEDWEAAQQKASQIQGDLDFNNNRQFWFGRESYPAISTDFQDL